MKRASDWRDTPAGAQRYAVARAKAQAAANATGFDHGVEANDVYQDFRVFMLPRRENRRGHELFCEVVHCEIAGKCQEGHGASW